MQKQKIIFKWNEVYFYKNIEIAKKEMWNENFLTAPFWKENDLIFINMDFFNINIKNKKEIKNYLNRYWKDKKIVLIWNFSIKNIIFFLRIFPIFNIIK